MGGDSGSILVVDDNEMNRDVLLRRLRKMGHSIMTADCGSRALELVDEHQFDLILLDVMMPGMSGPEVLQTLKADPVQKHIPVIMVSALTEMDSVVRCIELGAEDYLPKPFKGVLLTARVNACLEKKRLRDQDELIRMRLEEERLRTDRLLKVILPESVVDELKQFNTVKPRYYDRVAVLFCDVVGFTNYCNEYPAETVVKHLQELVHAFEELVLQFGIEKIKTIGDAFMATGGLLKKLDNPVEACVECALEMILVTQGLPAHWQVRIGVAVGPVMAGIVGHRKYLFDVWGDTVNLAARLQDLAKPNHVALSEKAFQDFGGLYSAVEEKALVKGMGETTVYHVDGCPQRLQ